MLKRSILFSAVSAALLAGCGTPDPRDQVVYPYNPPVPRAAEYRAPAPEPRANYGSCPGDAEELAEGSICPPTAQCFDISGGKRCIVYEK
ncbi:hypothetical protein [Microbulbifer yueqingensis]|uniref:Lipoprotein n=1 Tax=Microbulbifer yueqingensis TaxID=658219 RepID=A0A1G8VTU3_9GAMM|nr:hypothetical protein [Microbulbifer yueqingensis]SDJ68865.1 hypothetical protein SAMN05216212_0706 [Microbulbifer yueqingensis]